MANNFSSDTNCVALWRLENGALTTDSKGSNTLTNSGVVADTANYQEGAASADFDSASTARLSIADADLDAGFPGKNGTSNTTFSAAVWFRMDAAPGATSPDWNFHVIMNKWEASKYTYFVGVANNGGYPRVVFGVGNGTTGYQFIYHTGRNLSTATWYHLGVTYNGATQAYLIRLYDTSNSTAYNASGTTTTAVAVSNAKVTVGCSGDSNGSPWDGLLDELVILKDVLTSDEIDQIRAGTYGASSSSSSSLSSSSQSSSSSSVSSFSSSSTSSSSSSQSSSSSSLSSSYSFSSASSSSAAPLQFPALSKGVDLAIAEEIADTGLLASEAEQGRRLVQTHSYRAAHRLRLSVSFMSQADRRTLARFYLTTAAGAVRVWEWTHPKSGQTYLLSFDPESPPTWQREPRRPDQHHAEMTVVEHIADGYLTGVYL